MNWICCGQNDGFGYVEYLERFQRPNGRCRIRISADRAVAVYVNGTFVFSAHYADYTFYKCTDTEDVTRFLKDGENELLVLAFHPREDYAASRVVEPAVAFEVLSDEGLVCASSERTLCRVSPRYSAGAVVTPQLGTGFCYDFTAKETPYFPARRARENYREVPRPVPCPVSKGQAEATVSSQGIYRLRGGNTAAELAQNAWLSTLRFSEMTKTPRLHASFPLTFRAEGGDGIFVIVDLSEETVGFLSLCVTVQKSCRGILVWGEHLSDLRVRSAVGGRNFATELHFAKGQNVLEDRLHRLGCRYLCLFVESDAVTVERLTAERDEYPFEEIGYTFDDRLFQAIFEAGKRTLRLCAHEHYEDCPWREQALYGMDSFSHMLFGYSAFGETAFPRFNLRLIAYSLGEDGLIELCPPSRTSITIPSFSAYFLLALAANAEVDYREDFVKEMLPYAERILEAFRARTGKGGVRTFKETRYWNFHEWSEGLDGGSIFRSEEIEPCDDGLLTALVYLGAKGIAALEERTGHKAEAESCFAYADALATAVEGFYDPSSGLYASYRKNGALCGTHIYALALYLLTGLVPKERCAKLCAELKSPTVAGKETTAALLTKYLAILHTDGDREYILNDICRVFGRMLFSGATTFWETEEGEADFEDAGSLCHGWSAIACYMLPLLGAAKRIS